MTYIRVRRSIDQDIGSIAEIPMQKVICPPVAEDRSSNCTGIPDRKVFPPGIGLPVAV
jgi:hypothetical protein